LQHLRNEACAETLNRVEPRLSPRQDGALRWFHGDDAHVWLLLPEDAAHARECPPRAHSGYEGGDLRQLRQDLARCRALGGGGVAWIGELPRQEASRG